MKVIVYHDRRYGPAVVFLPPPRGAVPESAALPNDLFPRAYSQMRARGRTVSWADWGESLVRHAPYFEDWSVEEVPAGTSAHDALGLIRRKQAGDLIT